MPLVEAGIEKKITVDSFTIRVYGILMDSNKQVLLSDEFIRGGLFYQVSRWWYGVWRRNKRLFEA